MLDDRTYTILPITIKKFLTYIKELKNRKINKVCSDEYNDLTLYYFFGLKKNEIVNEDLINLKALITIVDIYMDVLIKKMSQVGQKDEMFHVQKKKSIFDDYDKENGYLNEEELNKDSLDIFQDNVNYIIKYCVSSRIMSMKDCLDSELIDVLEYVDFDIKYEEEHKNDNE